MFLLFINMSIFRFNLSKILFQLLVPIKFSITTFAPTFNLIFVFFNEIVQKCVKYSKKKS